MDVRGVRFGGKSDCKFTSREWYLEGRRRKPAPAKFSRVHHCLFRMLEDRGSCGTGELAVEERRDRLGCAQFRSEADVGGFGVRVTRCGIRVRDACGSRWSRTVSTTCVSEWSRAKVEER